MRRVFQVSAALATAPRTEQSTWGFPGTAGRVWGAMGKRDLIQQIERIRSRRPRIQARYLAYRRLQALAAFLEALADHEGDFLQEALRHVPVACVAVLEAYSRGVVREWVDRQDSDRDRVVGLLNKYKSRLDAGSLVAAHHQEVSVGDLLAHMLPLSSLSDIEAALGQLFGQPHFTALSSSSRATAHIAGVEAITKDPGGFRGTLESLFELRHTICHETGHVRQLTLAEMHDAVRTVRTFVEANEHLVFELTRGEFMPQQAFNLLARQQCAGAKKVMDEVLSELRRLDTWEESEHALFDDAHAAWMAYAKADSEYQARHYLGGSGYDMLYFPALREHFEARTAELRTLVEHERDMRDFGPPTYPLD